MLPFLLPFAKGESQTDISGLFRQTCADLAQNAEKSSSIAVAGKDDWFFLSSELRHLGTGPFWSKAAASVSRATRADAADPLPAILDFNDQLKKAGVELIIVPVPPKAVVYPEMLPGFTNRNETARLDNTLKKFYELLRSKGVKVLDLTDFFIRNKNHSQGPLYCRQDSHWSGNGCVLAGKKIAGAIRPFLDNADGPTNVFQSEAPRDKPRGIFAEPCEAKDAILSSIAALATEDPPCGNLPAMLRIALQAGPQGFLAKKGEWQTIEINGDLRQALKNTEIAREKLKVRKISHPGSGETVEPNAESRVILLGDSHNLVFHAGDDMLFSNAGLPDQLAFELGEEVELVAVRGSGATPARINLMRRAQQRKDYWKNKKCVIWCFSAREFTESDGWRKVPVVPKKTD